MLFQVFPHPAPSVQRTDIDFANGEQIGQGTVHLEQTVVHSALAAGKGVITTHTIGFLQGLAHFLLSHLLEVAREDPRLPAAGLNRGSPV